MYSFSTILAATLAAISLPLLASQKADVITLKNGNIISGRVENSGAPGVISLKHSDAKKALQIRETAIKTIDFGAKRKPLPGHNENILLSNGDYFPCQIQSIDEKQITFSSSYMGTHTIPRELVTAIKFNNSAKNTLYAGPGKNLSDWKILNSKLKDAWTLKNKVLGCDKIATIAKNITGLPDNYALEMDLEWTAKSPRLKIYFSNSSSDLRKKPDGYYLAINSRGLEITRYVKGRSLSLGHAFPDKEIFKNKKISISLYVNRNTHTITLYIDGQEIKQFKDPSTPPAGSIIILAPSPMTGTKTLFKNITVSTWNGGKILTNNKTAASAKNNDVLTDSDGNTMTGTLLNIKKTNDNLVAAFDIAFARKPIQIDSKKILQINLKKPAAAVKQAKKLPFTARLILGGSLSFEQSQLQNGHFNLVHSILGKIQISQDVVTRIAARETAAKSQ